MSTEASPPVFAPLSPTSPKERPPDLNSFRSSKRSNCGTPRGETNQLSAPSGDLGAPAMTILRSWFAALAPSATDHASTTFMKAWYEAARLPSLWAKASAVYNAAIALTLDPTGRLASAAQDGAAAPARPCLAEQLAATETALKHLLATFVSGSATVAPSSSPKRRPRHARMPTVKSGSSLKNSSMNEHAPPKKSKSAVFVDAAGKIGLWQVLRSRRKSAVRRPRPVGSTTGTASVTATNVSAPSSKHDTPIALKSMPSAAHIAPSGAGGHLSAAAAPVNEDGCDGADDNGWSDVESDAAGGDDEQELLRSVDLQVTRHLTGGMNDSDDSDADDPDVLGDLNQFAVLERLGRGAEGEVFLAMDTAKSELRAIKAVRRPVSNGLTRVSAAAKQKLDRIAREIAIMKRMRHRNVVTLHEVIDDPARDTMYFVMQYVEHGPIATLSEDGTISETVEPQRLVDYARQLCSGLQYLHGKGVIHRDIKPENILRGANEQVYLADFGVSENFDDSADHRIAGTRGTPAFLAPELLQLRSQRRHSLISEGGSDAEDDHDGAATDVDGEAVDVWALGITLYVLLYGKLPWEFTNAKDLFEEIQRRPIELRQPVSPSPGMSTANTSPQILPSPVYDGSFTRFSFSGAYQGVVVASNAPPHDTTVPEQHPIAIAGGGGSAVSPSSDAPHRSASILGGGGSGATTPSVSVSVGRIRPPSSSNSAAAAREGSGLVQFPAPPRSVDATPASLPIAGLQPIPPMPDFADGADLSVADCSAYGDEGDMVAPMPPAHAAAPGGGPLGDPAMHPSPIRRPTGAAAAAGLPHRSSSYGFSPNPKPSRGPSLSPAGIQSFGMNLSAANLSMTGPMARSFLPSGVMASNASDGWRRVLFGMLQRDPHKRSSLATVRKQLQQLERKLEASWSAAGSPNLATAFTLLQE